MKIETNEHFEECSDVTGMWCVVVLSRFNVPKAFDKMSAFSARINIIFTKFITNDT